MRSEAETTHQALYGDGETATRVPVTVWLADDGLTFRSNSGVVDVWPYPDIRTSEPVRRRSLDSVIFRLNGSSSLYVDDTVFLAKLLQRAPHIALGKERWLKLRPALPAGFVALAAAATIWAFDLSPTKTIARTMPAKARIVLGDSIMRSLPSTGTCKNPEGFTALSHLTARLLPHGPVLAENIVVLDVKTGDGKPLVNAFAVPGGRIILTRGLIDKAQSADEIAAVIGHESGHIIELHPEASLIRSVGFWALVQMVFTGTPGAVSNIGVLLAQLSYSRAAEREADAHALRLLRDAGIAAKGMADFFQRADHDAPGANPDGATLGGGIFASHPTNSERIAFIQNQPTYAATAALDLADWKKLQGICSLLPVLAARPSQTGSGSSPASQSTPSNKPLPDPLTTAHASADRLASAAAEAARVAADEERLAAIAKAKAENDRLTALRHQSDILQLALASNARLAAEWENQRIAAEKAEAARAQAEAKQKATVPQTTQQTPSPPDAPTTALDTRIASATKRIATNPADVAALYERGRAFADKSDLAAAVGDFTHIIALQPNNANSYFWRASIYARLEMIELAIADYTDVLRIEPRNFAAYNNRGSLYKAQKKLDLALADYNAALKIDPRQAITLTNRALVYRERRELDAALADLTAAISANPNYINAYVRRGETYELKSQRSAAISDYRQAVSLPDRAEQNVEPRQTANARLRALDGKE